MARILCIDDDMDLGNLLKRFLAKNGHETDLALNGKNGLKLFEEHPYDLVFCDFRLPDFDGLEMIKQLKSRSVSTPVILITAYSDVKIAVKSIQMGAYEYVTKPILPDEILVNVNNALADRDASVSEPEVNDYTDTGTQSETASAPVIENKPPVKKRVQSAHYIVGQSPESKKIQNLIDLVASTDMTVMLLGESGTGKELAARAIHDKSNRAHKPFVAVDCGALPHELAGTELFGYKKGAFTGANSDKKGHFELANGGTLFLDELGNLSYENQVKLLRALQERKVRPLGDEKDVIVDIRIIVATNENLKSAVDEGNFRGDILYRLNEFSIKLLPLRERQEDIPLFAEHFIQLANEELGTEVTGLDPDVLLKFQSYSWPGNLREMRNIIKRCSLFARKGNISVNELPMEINHPQIVDLDSEDLGKDEILDLKTATDRAEKKAILNALIKTNYNKSKTASLLAVDRKTLYNKMNALGIEL